MMPITIVTGAPGTGKTTAATLLAGFSERGLHIPSDIFYTFPAHPIPPHLPAAHSQNEAIIAALLQTAVVFARRGYDVILDGIFGPWFLPFIAAQLLPDITEITYVILHADLSIAMQRIRGRVGHPGGDVVRQMHGEFESQRVEFGQHELEVGQLGAVEAAGELERLRKTGKFRLALRQFGQPGK